MTRTNNMKRYIILFISEGKFYNQMIEANNLFTAGNIFTGMNINYDEIVAIIQMC